MSMKLKPVDALVHLYYSCSRCGERGFGVSIEEARAGSLHYCPHCGKIDKIEPVRSVTVNFAGKKKSQPRYRFDEGIIADVKKRMTFSGYGKAEAKQAIEAVLQTHKPDTSEELFKLAVLKHDAESP